MLNSLTETICGVELPHRIEFKMFVPASWTPRLEYTAPPPSVSAEFALNEQFAIVTTSFVFEFTAARPPPTPFGHELL